MNASKPSAINLQPSIDNQDLSVTTRRKVSRYVGARCEMSDDDLPVEEPLQIRLAGEDVAITMRTPGHDIELTAGFLYSEGIIAGKANIEGLGHCLDEEGLPTPNIINIFPTNRDLVDPKRWRRDFFAASSCGLCGKTSLESVTRSLPPAGANITITL